MQLSFSHLCLLCWWRLSESGKFTHRPSYSCCSVRQVMTLHSGLLRCVYVCQVVAHRWRRSSNASWQRVRLSGRSDLEQEGAKGRYNIPGYHNPLTHFGYLVYSLPRAHFGVTSPGHHQHHFHTSSTNRRHRQRRFQSPNAKGLAHQYGKSSGLAYRTAREFNSDMSGSEDVTSGLDSSTEQRVASRRE